MHRFLPGTAAVVGLILWSFPSAALAQSGSPVIADVSKVKVNAPVTGAQVLCFVGPGALDPATIGANTDVEARNLSTGELSGWRSYDAQKGTYLTVGGAGGDVIELKARNLNFGEASETVGYVPNPVDIARPEFNLDRITSPTTPDSSGAYHVVGTAGALSDESFPLVVEIAGSSVSAITVQAGSSPTSSLTPFDFPVSGTLGDVVSLSVTDAFGNRSELGFVLGGGIPSVSDGHFPAQYQSATQSDAERAGVTDYENWTSRVLRPQDWKSSRGMGSN